MTKCYAKKEKQKTKTNKQTSKQKKKKQKQKHEYSHLFMLGRLLYQHSCRYIYFPKEWGIKTCYPQKDMIKQNDFHRS